jgi:hypothetical protein
VPFIWGQPITSSDLAMLIAVAGQQQAGVELLGQFKLLGRVA